MPHLRRVRKLDFNQAKVEDWGTITLLKYESTEQKLGLRTTIGIGTDGQIPPQLITNLKNEADILYLLNERHFPTPRFLGVGEVSGLQTPLDSYDNIAIIKNGFPFYAREWIDGERPSSLTKDVLPHSDTLARFAIDFGERLEELGFSYKPELNGFVLSDGKITFVKPSRVRKGKPNSDDLYNILPEFFSSFTPFAYIFARRLRDLPDGYSYGPRIEALKKVRATKELLENLEAGRIKSFRRLGEILFNDVVPEIVDSLDFTGSRFTRTPYLGEGDYGVTRTSSPDKVGIPQPRPLEETPPQPTPPSRPETDPEADDAADSPSLLRRYGTPSQGFVRDRQPGGGTRQELYVLPVRKTKKPYVTRRNRDPILNLVGKIYPILNISDLKEAVEEGRELTEPYNNAWEMVTWFLKYREENLHYRPEVVEEGRKLKTWFEELDELLRPSLKMFFGELGALLRPSFTGRDGEFILNGKYNPIKWAKEHPTPVAGVAGLLFSELYPVSPPDSLPIRLLGDIGTAGGAIFLRYMLPLVSNKDKIGYIRSTFGKALATGILSMAALGAGIFLSYQDSQGVSQRIADGEQARATAPAPAQVSPTPALVPIARDLPYFGDQITGSSRIEPRKGYSSEIVSVGYDKTHTPTLLLRTLDGVNILVPCNLGGGDQFEPVSSRLKGKKMYQLGDVAGVFNGEYRGANLSAYILPPTAIKVANQMLTEVCK